MPIPLVPTRPSTWPGLGVGSLCNLKEFMPYLCTQSLVRFLGRFIIFRAPKGHFFTHRPHPMHRGSFNVTILSVGPTSMHNLPDRFIGHTFLHSYTHFLGLHLSLFTIAILNNSSIFKILFYSYILYS